MNTHSVKYFFTVSLFKLRKKIDQRDSSDQDDKSFRNDINNLGFGNLLFFIKLLPFFIFFLILKFRLIQIRSYVRFFVYTIDTKLYRKFN